MRFGKFYAKTAKKDSTQYSILNQENHVIYTTDSDQKKGHGRDAG